MEGRDAGVLPGLSQSGITFADLDHGFSFRPATGFHASGQELADELANGIQPGSAVSLNGQPHLYDTGTGTDGNSSIHLLDISGTPAVAALDVLPEASLSDLGQPQSPTVIGSDGDWTMYFAATDAEGATKMYRATSSNGIAWTPDLTPLLDDDTNWHNVSRIPSSVDTIDASTLRLYYAGFNGSRYRIGSALSTDGGESFEWEPGAVDDWILGSGPLGEFDDTHVRDPEVFQIDDTLHMLYSAFDGGAWHIGHATLVDGLWVRDLNGFGEGRPAMSGLPSTFSVAGVDSPTVFSTDDELSIWYGGLDGDIEVGFGNRRLGYAAGSPDALFAQQLFPTSGDYLSLTTTREASPEHVIELAQRVESFTTSGTGGTALTLDEERGFLYVVSKLHNYIYVLDIRDDSADDFIDANVMDIEALIAVDSNIGSRGFRDLVVLPGENRMVATGHRPDALVVFDISGLEDNALKEVYIDFAIGSLTLPSSVFPRDDAGSTSFARFGGANIALTTDGRLFVTHFRDNSVLAFDMTLGSFGEQIGYIPYLGENPYALALSPDEKHLVVANYVGEMLENGSTSSTLVVIDVDPTSPTNLQPLTWIGNQ